MPSCFCLLFHDHLNQFQYTFQFPVHPPLSKQLNHGLMVIAWFGFYFLEVHLFVYCLSQIKYNQCMYTGCLQRFAIAFEHVQ